MKILVFYIFAILISFALGTGLNADFSWSRINYQWNTGGGRTKRQTERGSYSGGKKNADKIIFDGMTNGDQGTKGNDGGNVGQVDGVGSVDYQYENNVPMGASVWKNKLFITVPRRRLGVPSTLNYVPLDSQRRHNVPLIPYPNWNINLYPDTSGTGDNFVSVYRVAVDACDRLWFADTGTLEIPGNRTQAKPTTLVIIDLQTDKVIHKYVFPEDQLRPATALASLKVDVTKDTCEEAFAYLPDLSGYGLVVYNLKENKSWRVTHNYFYLEPTAGEFFIAGHHFQWNDGVFSVELSDLKPDGSRDLYFHAMAGTNMYKVSTRVLRNETLATRSYHDDDFKIVGTRGPNSQTSSADIHQKSGVMFLALVNQNALGCWNTQKPLSVSVVQKDDEKMIYPSDVKVYDDNVYVLTNTMPEFLYGRLNYDVTNFRVWSNSVEDAVEGTACR